MFTINDIENAKEMTGELSIMDVCHYGYLVKDKTGDITVKDEEFVIKNRDKIGNIVSIEENKPVVYIPETNIYDLFTKKSYKDVFFWGKDPVIIETKCFVKDDNPSKRCYSHAVISLNGKNIEGTVEKIENNLKLYNITSPSDMGYSKHKFFIEFTGRLDTKYYSNALKREYGFLTKNDEGKIEFMSGGTREFCKYRSGCGHPEHYIIPNSEYKKYVEVKAVIPDIGERISIHYEVSESPEFLLQQKIKSCSKELSFDPKSCDYMDYEYGGRTETISEATLMLKPRSDNTYCVTANYIADEYRHRTKALEYENCLNIYSFCKSLIKDFEYDEDTIERVITEAEEVKEKAESLGVKVNDINVDKIREMIEDNDKER